MLKKKKRLNIFLKPVASSTVCLVGKIQGQTFKARAQLSPFPPAQPAGRGGGLGPLTLHQSPIKCPCDSRLVHSICRRGHLT